MKRKWVSIVAALLAVMVVAVMAPVALAQDEEQASANGKPRTPPLGLALVAPAWTPVGEEVSMAVFDRRNQDPVKDANIWAITKENVEALKSEITQAREQKTEIDWEALVSVHGKMIGTTKGNGKISYTFNEGGHYLLVAVKQGYMPGRSGITVRTIPVALGIRAPRQALVGDSVTMTVFQRGTEEPIKDAAIWALTREQAEALKAEIAALSKEDRAAADWEAVVSVHGTILGTTHGNGELKHAFDNAGGYLLVAVKKGYIPGRTGIAITTPKPPPKAPTASNKAQKPTA